MKTITINGIEFTDQVPTRAGAYHAYLNEATHPKTITGVIYDSLDPSRKTGLWFISPEVNMSLPPLRCLWSSRLVPACEVEGE